MRIAEEFWATLALDAGGHQAHQSIVVESPLVSPLFFLGR
jgi:hypothetical protein